MKKLIILPFIILFALLVLPLVNSQQLLIKELNYADISTTSAPYITIGSDTFTLNVSSDVNILVTLVAELQNTGGAVDTSEFAHRIILDGEVLREQFGHLNEIGDNAGVTLFATKENLGVGAHILELQHKVVDERLNTKNIVAIVNTNTVANTTLVNTQAFDLQIFSVSTTSETLIASGNFNSNSGELLSFLTINYTNANWSQNQDSFIEYRVEVDSQSSGSIFPYLPDDTGGQDGDFFWNSDTGYMWKFENLTPGNHNFSIFADIGGATQKFPSSVTGAGQVSFSDISNDGLDLNLNHTFISSLSYSSSQGLVRIANATINIESQSGVYVVASFSSTGGVDTDTISMLEIEGFENSTTILNNKDQGQTGSGSGVRWDNTISFFFENAPQGDIIVHLRQSDTASSTTIFDISLVIIEAKDYDENIVIPPLNFKPAEDRNANNTALLVHDEVFADGLTTSSSFTTLGTINFEVNKTTDINILTNFEVEIENTGGAATAETGNWRILLDGLTVAESELSFLPPDVQTIDSITMGGAQQSVALGSHTVELQHKVTGERLLTRHINLFVNSNTFNNQTIVQRHGFNFTFAYESPVFVEIGTGTFTTGINQDIISVLIANYSLPNGIQQQIFWELDGVPTGVTTRQVKNLPTTFNLAANHLFQDVSSGLHTWKVFARNLPDQTGPIYTGDVDLVFFETKADGLEITTNTLNIEKEINLSPDIFIELGRLEIDLANQSDLAVLFSATFDTNTTVTAPNRDTLIDIQIRTAQGTSLTRNINLLGSQGTVSLKKFYNFQFIDIFEDFAQGKTNVSIFIKATPEKLNIINASLMLIEVDDYDLNFIAPQGPPIVTIISPANHTITNVFPLNITFSVSTNAPGQPDASCSLQNSTNVFSSDTFPLNTNVNLTLTEGQDINRNFTLDISCQDNGFPFNIEGSARINVFIDNILPVITIGSPQNGVRFNTDISTFINISGVCTDFPVFRYNITIRNETGNTVFDDEIRNDPVLANSITLVSEIATSSLALGNYTTTHTCADTHTRQRINDYSVTTTRVAETYSRTNYSSYTVRWITDKQNDFQIMYIPLLYTASTYGSTKQASGDRYNVWYNIDAAEDDTRRDMIFVLRSLNDISYVSNSRFDAHFIIKDNWIDFEIKDDPDATYTVTSRGSSYVIIINTNQTTIDFSSIGDLNIQIVQTSFEVFFVEQIVDALTIGQCPDNLPDMIILTLIIGFALFFIWIGFSADIGFAGLFGSIILLISTWYFVACIQLLAFAVAMLALVLILYFPLKGFFVDISKL